VVRDLRMEVMKERPPEMKRRLAQTLVCLALIYSASLASCVPPAPTDNDIVGLWVEDRPSAKYDDGGPCAYFVFAADGHFQVYNIPRRFTGLDFWIAPSSRSMARVDSNGTWWLLPSCRDAFALCPLELTFASELGHGFDSVAQLRITYPPERALLLGLPDDPYLRFYKRSELLCTNRAGLPRLPGVSWVPSRSRASHAVDLAAP
jgi:hypothetical protein